MSTADRRPSVTLSQVLCASVDATCALAMSLAMGYPSVALLSMEKDPNFEITEEQESWIGAIFPGMALIGSLFAGYVLEALGRRHICLMMSFFTSLSWACLAISSNAYQIIAARILTGVCLGIHQVASSVYFSETVHSKLRPLFLSVLTGSAWIVGFFVINAVSELTDWRGLSWMGCATSLLITTLLVFLPETPYSLLKSGNTGEALTVLKWLYQTEEEAQNHLKDTRQSLSSTKAETTAVALSDLLKPPYRWPFIVAVSLHVLQQTTGISAISTFMGLILERSGSSVEMSSVSLVITLFNIVSLFLSARMMNTCSRMTILRASSYLVIFPLLSLSGYLWAKENSGVLHDLADNLTFIPFLSIATFILGFSLGWSSLPWLFLGEGLPPKIREKCAGIMVATNWSFAFITTKAFSWGTVVLGSYGVYFIFALLTFQGMVFLHFYFPETIGFSDAQLEKYYKDSYKKKRN